MKKNLFTLAVVMLSLIGCTDSQFLDESVDYMPETPLTSNEVNALIEKARWGDGKAYLRLADCYRDGKGVKQDMFGMLAMVAQADEYGGIDRMEDYLETLPEGTDFSLLFNAVERIEDKKIDEANVILEQLLAKGIPDVTAVQGVMAIERDDTIEGTRLFKEAADAGSSLGRMLSCIPDWQEGKKPDVQRLASYADEIPYVNALLAKMYAESDDESKRDASLATHYYLKADEKACLDKRGARWLLGCHEIGELQLADRDIQRLRILAGANAIEESAQVTCRDEALEASVSQELQEAMTEYHCTKGMVYVVETATGSIKAQVSLASKGKQFESYEDTFNDEQSVMMTGPTYLALLSSGEINSHSIIETEYGIYKDVRDHNWRRGGYGRLTLEQALGYRSQVAFTKAKEAVFGNNATQFDNKISTYLADMPNEAMGVLTFYNAVANGGRMVKLVTESDEIIVLNDQIAEPKHIATLQKGLHHAVSNGLFRKAGRSYTTVAACGRTFQTKGNNRRMELCGYFPADNPLYTLMVVLEKEGIPASSGGMCGPIIANTIDLLVDTYNLQPYLTRPEKDDMEADVLVVDTVVVQ